MIEHPFVSVIMPVRNEGHFIERSLASVLAQGYPADRIEALVVDGMSDDDTRARVEQAVAGRSVPPVRVLDNPQRIVPTALNIGLDKATGDVVVRVDGHSEIAPDYLERCIDALARSGAECVGGPMTTVGETYAARAIALAQSCPFGVGGVAFRTGRREPGFVDTVAFGAYRRDVFARIGGFDEELVRNQDDELNYRLAAAGGRIYFDPSIRSTYSSRATLRGLWWQYFQYGLYKVRVLQKLGRILTWRHLVPAAFVMAVAVTGAASLVGGDARWLLVVIAPYVLASLAASAWYGGRSPSSIPLLPVAFAVLHLAYGSGFLAGLWRWRRGFLGKPGPAVPRDDRRRP